MLVAAPRGLAPPFALPPRITWKTQLNVAADTCQIIKSLQFTLYHIYYEVRCNSYYYYYNFYLYDYICFQLLMI